MAALTQYLVKKLLDHVTNNAAYTAPTTLYLALYTVAPTASTAGTELPTGTGYSRLAITFNAATLASENTTNSNTVVFGPNTTTNWGTIVAGAIVDSSTIGGGNILAFANLGASRTLNIGDRLEFDPGTVTVSLS